VPDVSDLSDLRATAPIIDFWQLPSFPKTLSVPLN
jgi:hypothetical protein